MGTCHILCVPLTACLICLHVLLDIFVVLGACSKHTLSCAVAVCPCKCRRHVVRCLGSHYDRAKGRLQIFLEFMPGGSVRDLLRQFGPCSEQVARLYTRQVRGCWLRALLSATGLPGGREGGRECCWRAGRRDLRLLP